MKYLTLFLLLAFIMLGCKSQKPIQKEETNNKANKIGEKVKEFMQLDTNQILVATISTNMGDIVLQLFPDKAPKTVENFVGLATEGYYNGVIFHRVIDDFMIQGGDPTGTGSGGESFFGGTFEDEFNNDLKHSEPGILSMANAGPNTNGSQFFITTVETPHLNGRHTIFGYVKDKKSFAIVKKLENVPTGYMDKPKQEQKIIKAYIK